METTPATHTQNITVNGAFKRDVLFLSSFSYTFPRKYYHSGAVEKRPFPKYTSAISQRCLCGRPLRADSAPPIVFRNAEIVGEKQKFGKRTTLFFLHNEACTNGLSDSASLRIIQSASEKELHTALMIPRREQRALRWTHCDSSCFSPLHSGKK